MTMMLRMAGTLGQRLEVDPALVGWWKFDGDLTDASGNGNNGTVGAGSAAYAAGVYGQAWDSNATRFVEWADADWNRGGLHEGFTVSAWIFPTSKTNGRILDKSTLNSSSGGFYFIAYGADETIQFRINAGDFAISQLIPPLNEWSFVSAVIRANGLTTIFLNGVPGNENALSAPSQITTTNTLKLGNSRLGERPFLGKIDNLMIFNRALTPSEIKYVYDTGRPIPKGATVNA